VGYFSPLSDCTVELKEGDLVKVDLGCQIDGFCAQAAHSVLVQADGAAPVTGRAADVMAAAATCFDAAARLIRPGRKISEVAPVLSKIAEAHGCTLVDGVMSHQMKRFIIDAGNSILNRPAPDQRLEDAEFEEGEVYAIDIVTSTGDGKAKVHDERETTVFKRALEVQHQLRIKAARDLFSEINKKFPTMLFSLRGLEDGGAGRTRLGLADCVAHDLLQPYPVTYDKAGELVAQVKGTVLLMPNGSSDRITAAPAQVVKSEKVIEDEEIKALLATSLKKKKGKKAKAAKEGAAEA
jgi:curved DNA binding protein